MSVTTRSPRLLTASDRCDRCGAGAQVLITLRVGGQLSFCRHHARQHQSALQDQAALIDDQSERILAEQSDR